MKFNNFAMCSISYPTIIYTVNVLAITLYFHFFCHVMLAFEGVKFFDLNRKNNN